MVSFTVTYSNPHRKDGSQFPVELAVSADPLTRNLSRTGAGRAGSQGSRITAPEAHWPEADHSHVSHLKSPFGL